MARPLRIEYEGAIYHIISWGMGERFKINNVNNQGQTPAIVYVDIYQISALDPLLDGFVPSAGSLVIETFALYYGDPVVGNFQTRIV
jgi:hypothetical protein